MEKRALLDYLYVGAAALAFATGGIFMKLSQGLARWPAVVAVFVCFVVGAALQALAMERRDLGVIYILVLGAEAVLAFGFGVALFEEVVTLRRLLALGLIVVGIALLR